MVSANIETEALSGSPLRCINMETMEAFPRPFHWTNLPIVLSQPQCAASQNRQYDFISFHGLIFLIQGILQTCHDMKALRDEVSEDLSIDFGFRLF